MSTRGFMFFMVLVYLALNTVSLPADEVVGTARLRTSATVEGITFTDSGISGQVVNPSHKRLENVRILVTHAWLWADDRRTDEDSPGWAEYYMLSEPIQPNSVASFSYPHKSPYPKRNDGHFISSVRIVGLTEFESL